MVDVLEVDGIESFRLSSLRRGLLNFFSVKCDICGGYDNEQYNADHMTHAMTICYCHRDPDSWEKEASKMSFHHTPICHRCWFECGHIHDLYEHVYSIRLYHIDLIKKLDLIREGAKNETRDSR